jgi:hypothetical protein
MGKNKKKSVSSIPTNPEPISFENSLTNAQNVISLNSGDENSNQSIESNLVISEQEQLNSTIYDNSEKMQLEQNSSAVEEPKPTVEEPKPTVDEEPKPTVEEPKPTVEEPKPTVDEEPTKIELLAVEVKPDEKKEEVSNKTCNRRLCSML